MEVSNVDLRQIQDRVIVTNVLIVWVIGIGGEDVVVHLIEKYIK